MDEGRAILEKLQQSAEILEDHQQRLETLTRNLEVVYEGGSTLEVQVNVVVAEVITVRNSVLSLGNEVQNTKAEREIQLQTMYQEMREQQH